MTVQQTVSSIDASTIRSLSEKAREPEWLTKQRVKAWELYLEKPVPKLEKTDLTKRDLSRFQLSDLHVHPKTDAVPDNLPSLFRETEKDHALLIQKNADVIYESLRTELQGQGVIFTDLRTAAQKYETLVKPYLGKLIPADEDKFVALNTAAWGAGVFVYVPRNVSVEIPLQSFFWAAGEETGMFTRVLMVVEEGASVTYIDGYQSDNTTPSLHVGVVEVFVKANASVQFGTIQNNAKEMQNLIYRRAHVDRDGSIDWNVGELGDGFTVASYKSLLEGQGAKANVKAISVGVGRQHLDLTSHTVHAGKHSESDMTIRGVMRDKAKAVFRGVTQILKDASGSNGQQSESLMMLSPTAKADAIPMLLIDENDVKCGHAASVGKINQEQLYYLMSRGISKEEAEKLILFGFLDPVISNIPLEGVQTALIELIERKLGQ
jgi:Fe-S cluster assembly protein SufD